MVRIWKDLRILRIDEWRKLGFKKCDGWKEYGRCVGWDGKED